MGHRAVYAGFSPFVIVCKVSAAFVPKKIKGTVAEKTVEVVRIPGFVTWKHFALCVLKEAVVF